MRNRMRGGVARRLRLASCSGDRVLFGVSMRIPADVALVVRVAEPALTSRNARTNGVYEMLAHVECEHAVFFLAVARRTVTAGFSCVMFARFHMCKQTWFPDIFEVCDVYCC